MTLRNTECRITLSSDDGRYYYHFAGDGSGWYQITAAGNRLKATAEQVLNHLLPALAEIKPSVRVVVEYVSDGPPGLLEPEEAAMKRDPR